MDLSILFIGYSVNRLCLLCYKEESDVKREKDKVPDGYCVCCPGCGRMFQRSIETVSKIHCQKCSADFMVFLKDRTMMINVVDTRDDRSSEAAYAMWELVSGM